ncbi:MAG TPA: hypothetical protein VNZ53_00620 [Steroidobacteraceae bacterium]|nr:hypothetical protein [Steroidobacteraceae bacterium]
MHNIGQVQQEFQEALHEFEHEAAPHEVYGHEMSGHEVPGHEVFGHEVPGHEVFGHEMPGHEVFGHEMPGHEVFGHEMPGHEVFGHEMPGHEVFGHEAEAEVEVHTGPLTEAEEMEYATRLLEVTHEAELEQFLGGLIRRVGRAVGGAIRSPVFRALGGVLRPLARAALPVLGTAVGGFFGGPLGGAAGGRLASAAGRLFGLELEGLSHEDREYEVARRFVRLAAASAQSAMRAPPTADPNAIARAAVLSASRRLAPGLRVAPQCPVCATVLTPGADGVAVGVTADDTRLPRVDYALGGMARKGTWFRRGRRIVLLGL